MKLGANDVDTFNLGVSDVDRVMLGVNEVWVAYDGPPSPVSITASGNYVAGVDFPSNTEITVWVAGGGGGGAMTDDRCAGGGYRGEPVGIVLTLPKETVVPVVIGGGGAGGNVAYTGGGAGGASNFGSHATGAGGAGGGLGSGCGTGCNQPANYLGNGGSYESPATGETYTDGLYGCSGRSMWGGQAGAFGNGANQLGTALANTGGGGGGSNKHGAPAHGGSGKIEIRW